MKQIVLGLPRTRICQELAGMDHSVVVGLHGLSWGHGSTSHHKQSRQYSQVSENRQDVIAVEGLRSWKACRAFPNCRLSGSLKTCGDGWNPGNGQRMLHFRQLRSWQSTMESLGPRSQKPCAYWRARAWSASSPAGERSGCRNYVQSGPVINAPERDFSAGTDARIVWLDAHGGVGRCPCT